MLYDYSTDDRGMLIARKIHFRLDLRIPFTQIDIHFVVYGPFMNVNEIIDQQIRKFNEKVAQSASGEDKG